MVSLLASSYHYYNLSCWNSCLRSGEATAILWGIGKTAGRHCGKHDIMQWAANCYQGILTSSCNWNLLRSMMATRLYTHKHSKRCFGCKSSCNFCLQYIQISWPIIVIGKISRLLPGQALKSAWWVIWVELDSYTSCCSNFISPCWLVSAQQQA